MKESMQVGGAAAGGHPPNVFVPSCPSRVLLDHVTSRWAVLILVALSSQTLRWGELRRRLNGVTDKMLASALRTLEADALILREAYPEVPPRVDYSLTERGRELAALLLPLVDWAEANAGDLVGASDA
ncbi:winged helix-turn-helix transcriptional regulator [Dactylosporangium sp. NPDC048998]|uniref:winged helix-turn-helix transcriptional regulator n=1 Tax=Dactylosporangium sp. NPDC048998 TaxID=3363976 RepID=UPI003723BEB1